MSRRHTRLALALVLLIAALLTPLRAASGGRASALPLPVPIPAGSATGATPALPRTLGPASVAARARTVAGYGRLPLAFERNQGQTDRRVSYLARGAGYTAFLSPGSLTLSLSAPLRTAPARATSRVPAASPARTVVRLRLEGTSGHLPPLALHRLPGVANYLIGNDPRAWHTDVPTYAQVTYPQVYPGVDWTYRGTQDRLEYDFVVHPGADPRAIRLSLAGSAAGGAVPTLDTRGAITLRTAAGTLIQPPPVAYQAIDGRRPVRVGYRLVPDGRGGRHLAFALGRYDHSRPLVIDPVIVYSTYLGGGDADDAYGLAIDSTGAAYIAGQTRSTTFPTTAGALQGAAAGSTDAFVAKLNPAGSALVYSTYLGGSGSDIGQAIAVDSGGNAYVAGQTGSSNFPVAHAYQGSIAGGLDAFVTKLNPAGNALVYSTYLGGSNDDQAYGIAVDGGGAAVVAGGTGSTNFPTAAAYQGSNAGSEDAFVTKLNAAGSALVYSTYLGGGGVDYASAVALGGTGAAYIAGTTASSGFATPGAFQATNQGGQDAFVAEFGSTGGIGYATELGGSGNDQGYGIAVDGGGNAYATGVTGSSNFPTVNPIANMTGGGTEAFVTKLNPAGSALVYSTYLGGSAGAVGYAMALDGTGDAYVGGTANAGSTAAFAAELNPAGSAVLADTTFQSVGGAATYGIAVDGSGDTYLAGYTTSATFPVVGGVQAGYGGQHDAFVAELGPAASSGYVPWHPHTSVRMAAGLGATVDLADGHVDVTAAGMKIRARGLDLGIAHTWDSTRADVPSTAGQGWQTDLTQGIATSVGGTLIYTDPAGTAWTFLLAGSAYTSPPGYPWQLTTPGGAYLLTNILTGERRDFNSQGQYTRSTDAYGNTNTVNFNGSLPINLTNSGGRAIALSYAGSLVADVQSPLYQSGGAAQQGSQHLAYAYSGQQLNALTRGANTSDAATARFGYSANLLTSVTTPLTMTGTLPVTQTWGLGYNAQDRLVSITSPVSGTVGQPGYTPAYTTAIAYSAGSTRLVRGFGSGAPITTTYSLDAAGRATAVTDALGHTRQFTYDAANDVATSQDGNGNTTTNHYQYIGSNNSYGQLTEVDHPQIRPLYPTNAPVAPTTHYVYDPTSHDLTERYDNYGAVTWYTYNGQHDIASTAALTGTTALGGTTAFHWRGQVRAYDAYGEPTSAVDGRGVAVPDTSSTNTAPSVTANGSAASYTHSSTYNSYGDQTSASTPPITTAKGGTASTGPAITQYTYDGDGNQITMQSANNYNAADPTTNATIYGYDHLGRQNSTKQPSIPLVNPPPSQSTGMPLSTIKFDGDGNAMATEDGSGTDTFYSYDPLGRTVSIQQPLSLRVQIDPRAVAQTALTIMTYTATYLASTKDPQGHVTTVNYDAAGRETGMVNGAGQQLGYGYDSANNLTSTATGSPGSPSSTTTWVYDALNQPTGQTTSGPNLPGALTTVYSYDLHRNLVRKQDPNNDTSFAAYDLVDQLVGQELDPGAPNTPTGAHQESFAYDAAGDRVGGVDFRGGTTAMVVDGDGRQTGQTDSYTGVPTISSAASFDPDGNLVGQTQTIGGQTRSFAATLNPADWPQQATNDGLSSSTTGAGAGDLLSQTIQNNAGTVSYNIDQLGRQNGIGVTSMGSTTPLTTTLAFNSNEQMTGQALPNNVEQDAGYDGANRLNQITAKNNTTPSLLNTVYQYGYDPLGLTSGITTTVQGAATSQTLTHDAAGRLTAVAGGSSSGSWAYDGRDNLTSATAGGVTRAYTYSPSNPEEVASTSVGGGPATAYGYDGNGNATSIAGPGGLSEALSYDAQSRLVQVTLGSPITSTIALAYNAFGQRAGYTVTPAGAGGPSLAESFKYQGDQLSQVTYTGTSVPTPYTDTYVYTQDGSPLELLRQQQGASTATPYWYVVDGQGNVVSLTNQAGNVVDSYSYNQWGKPTTVSESVPQQLRYAGYWYDSELAWYWLTVRSYDPALQRFLQPDPSEIEGLFSYVYAADDPADRTDPSRLPDCGVAEPRGPRAAAVGQPADRP